MLSEKIPALFFEVDLKAVRPPRLKLFPVTINSTRPTLLKTTINTVEKSKYTEEKSILISFR